MTPRLLAHELLVKAEKSKQYSNIALDNALKTSDMSDADKRLTAILFYGVTEKRITLDYQISKLSSRPIKELDGAVLTALRLGIYQLEYLDRIPAHAAINETVDLCSRKTAGFVNAILRGYTRQKGITLPEKENTEEYLSVKHSVCQPIVKKFLSVFGEGDTELILEGFNNCAPQTTLRVNTLKASREELISKIDGAAKTRFSPHGIYVKGSVRELYGFDEGLFFVQDEASQICVEALGAKKGDMLLDICSCPGSKSFGSAMNMENSGQIISFDLHENKLSLVRSGAERLGIDIVTTRAQDGRVSIPELIGKADKVLCDVPCSGFGVLAKKPELRYKDPAESASLPSIQLNILENACKYLKVGGTLVYSTCTLLPEENQLNVNDFLKRHTDFELSPWSIGDLSVPEGMITLYPHVHSTDGFFIAKLTRKKQ